MNSAPKKRNAVATKARILKEAQRAFAQHGYSETGIRDIATAAGISSPLLLRYFGSKAGLFEAALIDAVRMEEVFGSDRSRLGSNLVNLFQDSSIEITPPAIIALAAGHPEAQQIAARVAEEHVIQPFARWLGGDQAEARAAKIFMLATSYILYTRQIPIIAPGSQREQQSASWLAQAIQALADG